MTEHLSIERDDRGVVVLTIQREAKRNALHDVLWRELREAAEALAKAPPRAVILTGAGQHFSAGMDLSPTNAIFAELLPAIAEKATTTLRRIIEELKAVPASLERIPCPVIAAIEGVCAGGGLELALASDLRIAARDARFSMPETRVGLMADVGGTVRTTRLLGRSRATELLLTGRVLSGVEAEAWGLVTRLAEPGQALAEAHKLATEIVERAPVATEMTLGVLRRVDSLADAEAFEAETAGGLETLLGGECVEGAMAFMEKRPPRWRDKPAPDRAVERNGE